LLKEKEKPMLAKRIPGHGKEKKPALYFHTQPVLRALNET